MTLTCNGQPAQVEDLLPALVNYGHFTSLQVRDHAVQGLDLHLARHSVDEAVEVALEVLNNDTDKWLEYTLEETMRTLEMQ